jgi:hypothetical protein
VLHDCRVKITRVNCPSIKRHIIIEHDAGEIIPAAN